MLRETSKAWVEVIDNPTWLKDGSFLWQSARNGWQHLYHYAPDGKLVRQVTDGKWEARTLDGVDEDKGLVYFSGTEHSHIARASLPCKTRRQRFHATDHERRRAQSQLQSQRRISSSTVGAT